MRAIDFQRRGHRTDGIRERSAMRVGPSCARSVSVGQGRRLRRATVVVTALATSAFGLVAFAPSALAAPQLYTVNSAADPGDGTCDATCTLRDALMDSNASAGDHDVI